MSEKMTIRLGCWLVLFIGLVVAAMPARAQDSLERWSPPLNLGKGWWQSVTTDSQGNLHVGWYNGIGVEGTAFDFLTYAQRRLDGTWSEPNEVIFTTTGGYTVRNALAVTSNGRIFSVHRNEIAHFLSSSVVAAADNASTWSEPTRISSSGYYVDMLADRNDNLHIVFSGTVDTLAPPPGGGNPEASICAYCQDLFYRRSTDQGASWSDPYPLSIEVATGSDRMNIIQGDSGRLYIFWDEGYDWYIGKGQAQDVRFVYSLDQGETWSEPIIIDGGGFSDRRPIQIAMTETRDGSLMVIWRYSNDTDRGIYYQISSDLGQTWTARQPIPGIVARYTNDTPLDDFDLITDRLGNIHAFVVAQPNLLSTANAGLYHITYQQGEWLAPQRVFYSPIMRPEWPKVALGPSNDIHLTWFIRGIRENLSGQQDATGILEVFYSHLDGNLQPEPTREFLPTNTPLPTATIFLNLDPTLTPFPTLEGIDPNLALVTMDTYGSTAVLGGLFTSAIFCLAVAVGLRFWRRL
ncbi:MAG: exo-alpha-sialidase [Anaerolineae bacterium]|nr:exo-alpha-sialidase [Anaerolineae bacterium]